MNQVILASHSKMAEGIAQTVKFFCGEDICIETIEQTIGDSDFPGRARTLLERNKDKNCIVFTDLLGGSVNQVFMNLLQDYNFKLVSGMNLPIILECILTSETIDDTFVRNALITAKDGLCFMNDYLKQSFENDDED